MFGLGVLYTIISPFLLAYFALFLVYTLVSYLICDVYTIIFFFFGGGCSLKTKLEKELEKSKNLAEAKAAVSSGETKVVQNKTTIEVKPVEVEDKEGGIF